MQIAQEVENNRVRTALQQLSAEPVSTHEGAVKTIRLLEAITAK